MAREAKVATAGRRARTSGEPRHGTGDTPRSLGRRIELAWIWSVVGYSILRFVVAWGAFGEHGANIWVFGLIDVGTAWPYAKSVAVVTTRIAAGQKRRALWPAVVAVVTFMAPYLYLWIAARAMPAGMRTALVLVVTVLAIGACAGVWLRSRREALALEGGIDDVADRPSGGGSNFHPGRGGSGTAPTSSAGAEAKVIIDLRNEPAQIGHVQPGEQAVSTTQRAEATG